MAIKFLDDDYFKNEYYAKIGGISLYELNVLESEFLNIISFNLNVDTNTFEIYKIKLKMYSEL